MRTTILKIIALVALVVTGCSTDAPIEAPQSNHDSRVATIIAGSIGYESNGLSAIMADMVTAGNGETLRANNSADRTALVVTQNDSIFDPISRSQSLVLACQRNRGDAYSEWQLSYMIQYDGVQAEGEQGMPADAVAAETHADGTYRNNLLTAHGASTGKIGFVKKGMGRSAWLSGEYKWEGATTFRNGGENYGNVIITLNWNRLYVESGAGAPVLNGRCDVTIRANGPQGVISKNGTIIFDGSDRALLSIGGKQYQVSVRSPEYVREA